MKKLILMLIISFYSLAAFAQTPIIELDGVSTVNLSRYHYNSLGVSGNSSGAYSSGQCSIIIRTARANGSFAELAKALKFTRTIAGKTSDEFSPIVTNYGIIVMLGKIDFGWETINLETKNGQSIAYTISEFFPNETVQVMTGPCYPSVQ